VLGAALAWGGSGVLAGALQLDTWTEATGPDWTLFTSAMGIAMTAALLVVLVPIASLWRGNVRGTLGSARTGTFEGRGGRLENGLVVAEVGFAMLIAAGAALLVRSVGNVYAVEPGVRIAGVGVVDIMASGLGQSRPWEIVDGLTEAFNGMPGVRSAAIAQQLPLRGGGYRLPMTIEGRPDLEDVATEYRLVTPGYLEAIGIALLRGRTIGQEDRADKERVVVINEAFARTYFPGIDPIGRRVGGDIGSFARVIGVVADAAETQLTADPVPVRYVPVAQTWFDEAWSLVFHAPGVDPVALLDAARQTVQRVAPAVAVRNATTMSRVLDNAVGPGRQLMSLLSLLAGLALTLGAVGIYGVIAHFAARRRREWAIRMALGLRGYVAVGRVVGHATLLVMAGVGLGAVAAAGLSRLLASFLYDVSTIDTIAFVAAGAVLLAVGLLAAIVPALRTGMTNPAIVLREQ
jgi:predicted permease